METWKYGTGSSTFNIGIPCHLLFASGTFFLYGGNFEKRSKLLQLTASYFNYRYFVLLFLTKYYNKKNEMLFQSLQITDVLVLLSIAPVAPYLKLDSPKTTHYFVDIENLPRDSGTRYTRSVRFLLNIYPGLLLCPFLHPGLQP